MADILDFDAIQLSVASPTTIKGWSHGEVTKPETINYRTLRPEKGGLFCEKIFGPVKDWECHCGKYKRIRYKGIICDKCGVEVTQSKVRRERMAHISLAAPVAHPWFMRGTPSVLSLLLDLSPRSIDAVIYFSSFIVVSVDEKKKEDIVSNLTGKLETRRNDLRVKADEMISKLETELQEKLESLKDDTLKKEAKELSKSELELKTRQKIQQLRTELAKEEGRLEEVYKTVNEMVTTIKPLTLLSEDEYYKLYEYDAGEFLEVGMGAESILEVLSKMDLGKLSVELREEASKTTGQRHIKAGKRLRIVEGMRGAKVEPSWMVMQILPVIPPELRPMVQLSGGRFATSDLNDLYRRVINRNNRLKRLIDLGAPSIILRNEKRMLQEAVDALIDSSRKTTSRLSAQAETKSLTDMLQGKQGRFRQNLLGKRVDYSGRSVIVVGPELKLNQMGLPKEMALEMFKPFVLHELIVRGFAPNVKSAKHVLERRSGEVWDILEEITKNHPVLLNRAPTLHKLGIQAFYPILVEGNAIKIHPCVCAGYNADFDGDQMAVHIPLSQKARDEAVELMLASKNLLLPSSGAPITLPNREMSLGCYYLTYTLDEKAAPTKIFADFEEAIFANQAGKLELQTMINVRSPEGKMMQTTVGRILFGEVLPKEIGFVNKLIDGKIIRNLVMQAYETCENETVRKFIDDLKTLGFKYADKAGISIGIADCVMHPDRDSVIEAADQRVTDIDASYKNGLITRDEMRAISNDIWIETTDKVQKMTWDYMKFLNPLKMVVESGARGSKDQVKQLQGMRGLVADPTGRIVDLPTKSNFRLGLMVFEYFTSSRGSRKGFADRALRTSASGYLTRRLVDVAHDVIIREEDCMTPTGFILTRAEFKKHFKERLIGRFMAEDVIDPKTNKVLYPKDTLVTEDIADAIDESPVEFVMGRSPLTCQTRYGMCQKCYGWDVSNKKLVKLGTPVGVIAAQSIGEPGTQLTMRTFHTGGVIGLDITQGLPRVEELVEARIPKNPVPIAEVAGIVEIFETSENIVVRVKTDTKPVEEREYVLPLNADVKVQDGAFVDVGTPLMSGHLDVKQILAVQGLQAAQKYLIAEAQAVYESQGIPIHDKHFEVIARKMCDKVRIETQGDTVLLPGELIDRARFESENAKVMAEGGEPASAQVVILGITKASLYTESFLSAASFQETKNVLTEAAVLGKIDRLIGLKENVILGRLIPTSPERATEILNNQ